MIVPLSTSSNYKQSITFYPSSEYRLSEFTKSSFNLDNIGIDGVLKMRYTGELIPLRLPNQSSCGFKIMFKHKSFFKMIGRIVRSFTMIVKNVNHQNLSLADFFSRGML